MSFNEKLHTELAEMYASCDHDISAPADMAELYAARRCDYLGVWEVDGWKIKAYAIPFGRDAARQELINAAKQKMSENLPDASEPGTPGVGFIVIHDAEDAGFILFDWWANNIEIHQKIWYAEVNKPTELHDVPTPVVACMYELEIIDFERRAFIDNLRGNKGVLDKNAYLELHFQGDI